MRRVSSNSPTSTKKINWTPPRGDENSPTRPSPSSAPRLQSSPEDRRRSTSLRTVSGGARGAPTAQNETSSTHPTWATAPASASFEPFGAPVQFSAPAPARNKRKAEPKPKRVTRRKPDATTGERRVKIVVKLATQKVKGVLGFKRARTAEPEPERAPLPTPESEEDELDDDEDDLWLPGPVQTAALESPVAPRRTAKLPKTKTTSSAQVSNANRERTLQARRNKESGAHKAIDEKKLANFRAGKIYCFAPNHPRYDEATNMDASLRTKWDVWGTQEHRYQLERELYARMTDLERRMISTRRTKEGNPHRDLPKAVRALWYQNYTDLVGHVRSADDACHRCVIGGLVCGQPELPKGIKGTDKDGNAKKYPSCILCSCSKGVCDCWKLYKGGNRKPKGVFDFQVYLDRLTDADAWPQVPVQDLEALPPAFDDPLGWLMAHNEGKGAGRKKRAAEDELEQPRKKRASVEPEAESSKMGALRRVGSMASLTGQSVISKAAQGIKNVRGKGKASKGKQ
jgi:hypothetical protein